MPKIFKVSDTKAYAIDAIEIGGQEMISIRLMYKTKTTLEDDWKVGYKGFTFERKGMKKLGQYMIGLATAEDTVFTHIEPKTKEAAKPAKKKAKK